MLLEFWVALVDHHRSLDPDYPALPELEVRLRDEIEAGLSRPTCLLLVAESEAEVVGFAFAEDQGSRGDIHELYVVPSRWRSGTGRALAERAVAWLVARGVRPHVRVERANPHACRFWEKLGFSPIGERPAATDGRQSGPHPRPRPDWGRPAVYLERADC